MSANEKVSEIYEKKAKSYIDAFLCCFPSFSSKNKEVVEYLLLSTMLIMLESNYFLKNIEDHANSKSKIDEISKLSLQNAVFIIFM
jgi:hypothetical protein